MSRAREIDLRGASFDRFLAHAFERDGAEWQVDEAQDSTLLHVDAALQLAHAERLFRDPAAVARFSRAQREQGFDLFAADPHGDDAYMWFDLLEASAPNRDSCPDCEPVRRTIIGVLDGVLAMPQEHCQLSALHGLNHWGTDLERGRIIDTWLRRTPDGQLDVAPPGLGHTLRAFALMCRAGEYP